MLHPVFILLLAALPAVPAGRASGATGPRAVAARANHDRDTLAWVGNRVVTGVDLIHRIEWMPWAVKSPAGMDSAKVLALESLAAEALLAQDPVAAGTDSGAIAPMRAALRRALVRDALFHEVTAGVPAPSRERVAGEVRKRFPRARQAELPGLRRTVADSLRGLGIEARAADFLVTHLAGRRVTVDSLVFIAFSDSLRDYMRASGDAPVMGGGGYLVPADASDVMIARLSPLLGRPIAQMPDGPFLLRDALEDLRFYLFAIPSRGRAGFARELSQRLKTVIEGELMVREGLRRGLDARPEVRADLASWTDAWLARRRIAHLAAGPPVPEDDVYRRLAAGQPPLARELAEVDVEEILSDTRAGAQAVRERLEAGAPFDSLARASSRRTEWAARGGRSGYFPVRERPGLGTIALLAPADSIVGPGRLAEGWSVLRVRGKRLRGDSTRCAAALENARREAEQLARSARVDRYVAGLAGATEVRLNAAALRRIDILPANMVTKRRLGFGGGMLAAPSLTPLWGWTSLWREAHPALP